MLSVLQYKQPNYKETTLISALTLDAFYGKPTGSVTLNGVHLTDKLFKRHCYVMKQHDKHWPYLSCRETLQFSAELYSVAERKDIPLVVEEIIQKMGLNVCADIRCSRLSGGQQRRLSIGIALLKQVRTVRVVDRRDLLVVAQGMRFRIDR